MSNPESPSDYSILYQRAREEWDERLGSIVKQAHNWKMCAFFFDVYRRDCRRQHRIHRRPIQN